MFDLEHSRINILVYMCENETYSNCEISLSHTYTILHIRIEMLKMVLKFYNQIFI